MKPWPKSNSGQLLGLWILAILGAHLLAVLLLSLWRTDHATLHPSSVRTIETRVVSAYRAVSHAANTEELLQDISLPESRFDIAPAPTTQAGMDAQELAVAHSLRQRLRLPDELPVHVHLLQVDAPPGDAGVAVAGGNALPRQPATRPRTWALDIGVGYPDGRWLVAASGRP